jgi:hypothetical protein
VRLTDPDVAGKRIYLGLMSRVTARVGFGYESGIRIMSSTQRPSEQTMSSKATDRSRGDCLSDASAG